MAKLTDEELVAASDRKDWKLMWEEAIPLVKFAVKRITRARNVAGHHVTDDMVQEAMEAAGIAVRTWSPLHGSFSNWVITAAKQAIRHHMAREATGMVGGRDARAVFKSIDNLEISDGAPRDFRDPAEQAEEAADVRAVLSCITNPREREAVIKVYGIGVLPHTVREYAKSAGISFRTAYTYLENATARIAQNLRKSV